MCVGFSAFSSKGVRNMAGVGGFEPPHDGIKTRCLTAWRYPSNLDLNEAFTIAQFLELSSRVIRCEPLGFT